MSCVLRIMSKNIEGKLYKPANVSSVLRIMSKNIEDKLYKSANVSSVLRIWELCLNILKTNFINLQCVFCFVNYASIHMLCFFFSCCLKGTAEDDAGGILLGTNELWSACFCCRAVCSQRTPEIFNGAYTIDCERL